MAIRKPKGKKKGREKEKPKGKEKGKKRIKVTAGEDTSDYSYVEPGEWYRGKLVNCEEVEGPYSVFLRWSFEFLSDQEDAEGNDIEGMRISMATSSKLEPSQNLWTFAKVLLGREPEFEEDLYPDEHFGKKFRIFVEDGKKKNDDGVPYQNVTKIKPLKDKKGKKKKKK